MTSTDGRTAVTHILGATNSVATQLTSHSKPNCPLAVSMEVQNASGIWIQYSSSEISNLVSSYSTTDGSFNFDSTGLTFAQRSDFMPQSTYAIRQIYSSTDSLAADGTFEDYFSGTIRADCGDAILSKTSELSD